MSNLSDFLPLVGGSDIFRIARTSNVSLSKDEKGKLIDITSGTFTQAFDACATLGDGWFVYLKNSGTGDITLDPAGSETIDGLTSYIMYPGEVRLIQCDGAALRSVVINAFYKVITSSETFVKPPGYPAFEGLLWGGGASGAKSSGLGAGGGGGGACAPFLFLESEIGATEAVIIGAGGAGKTATGSNGDPGGTSVFVSTSAYGGSGGIYQSGSVFPGGGGGGVFSAGATSPMSNTVYGGDPLGGGQGADSTFGGGRGGETSAGNSVYGGGGGSARAINQNAAGNSIFGGGGGSGINESLVVSAFAGLSRHGGNGGMGATTASGQDGLAPGGGGGATHTGARSGAGARGELRIWGII